MSLPWKYIKLSELMSSVKSDLSLYDDAGLIDEENAIKIVMECNEKLGQRIYKPRECKIIVENFGAPIPSDLYKIENLLATKIVNSVDISPMVRARQLEFTYTKPEDTTRIITYGQMACTDSCNNCYWVVDRNPVATETQLVVESFIPLKLSNSLYNKCTEYCPYTETDNKYLVDMEEEAFSFSFEKGEIYLSYLGNLMSNDDEIQIPFHARLTPYYEYAIKEKVLEDMYLKSEADILQKLQYITNKKKEAYAIAWDFANTREVNEWNKIQKKLQTEYYNKWYRIFK